MPDNSSVLNSNTELNNIVTDLNGKLDKDFGNLTENLVPDNTAMVKLLDLLTQNNFTIVYPNGGTKESPANVNTNTTYIIPNPFPGYYIDCKAEIYTDGEWGVSGFQGFSQYTTDNGNKCYGTGIYIHQHNDRDIVMKTGSYYLKVAAGSTGNAYTVYPQTFTGSTTAIKTAPCRVKVWRLAKIPE